METPEQRVKSFQSYNIEVAKTTSFEVVLIDVMKKVLVKVSFIRNLINFKRQGNKTDIY